VSNEITVQAFTCELREIEVSDRIRMDFKDIDKLADSIRQFGQIEPIVVIKGTKTPWKLVAGERRYRACIAAGVTRIKAVLQENSDPLFLKEIEIEENVQRSDLSWHELVQAKLELDRIKRQQAGQEVDTGRASRNDKWKLEDTAKLIGEDSSGTRRDIELAKAMESDPKLADYLKQFPKTRAYQKWQEYLKIKDTKTRHEQIERELGGSSFFNGDCLIELAKVPDESVHLILTDPPFGIAEIDATSEKAGHVIVETDNLNRQDHEVLISKLIPILARKLKPGCFFFIFGGLEYFDFYKRTFAASDLEMNNRPLIWYKERTTTPFYGYSFQSCYEAIFYGLKPPRSRQLLRAAKDIINEHTITSKLRQHIFEKPVKLLRYLIEQSTFEGETVLDPFAGSFSTVIAALSVERKAIAIELNPNHYLLAIDRVAKWRKEHSKDGDLKSQDPDDVADQLVRSCISVAREAEL
jgi:ParB/RepB/Spo0J family partition protein